MIGIWADRVNLWVASNVEPRRPSQALRWVFENALLPDADPEDLGMYLSAAGDAWGLLSLGFGLLGVGLAFLGDRIGGDEGNIRGIALGAVPVVACLLGEFDCLWRFALTRRARRMWAREGALDERARRSMRIARANDGGFVLQLLGGLIAAALILVLA